MSFLNKHPYKLKTIASDSSNTINIAEKYHESNFTRKNKNLNRKIATKVKDIIKRKPKNNNNNKTLQVLRDQNLTLKNEIRCLQSIIKHKNKNLKIK